MAAQAGPAQGEVGGAELLLRDAPGGGGGGSSPDTSAWSLPNLRRGPDLQHSGDQKTPKAVSKMLRQRRFKTFCKNAVDPNATWLAGQLAFSRWLSFSAFSGVLSWCHLDAFPGGEVEGACSADVGTSRGPGCPRRAEGPHGDHAALWQVHPSQPQAGWHRGSVEVLCDFDINEWPAIKGAGPSRQEQRLPEHTVPNASPKWGQMGVRDAYAGKRWHMMSSADVGASEGPSCLRCAELPLVDHADHMRQRQPKAWLGRGSSEPVWALTSELLANKEPSPSKEEQRHPEHAVPQCPPEAGPLDLGAGEGPDLQHIGDQKTPKDKILLLLPSLEYNDMIFGCCNICLLGSSNSPTLAF
ncbi:hypothetical protein AAY473_000784 [Plecturocebus cupreus]